MFRTDQERRLLIPSLSSFHPGIATELRRWRSHSQHTCRRLHRTRQAKSRHHVQRWNASAKRKRAPAVRSDGRAQRACHQPDWFRWRLGSFVDRRRAGSGFRAWSCKPAIGLPDALTGCSITADGGEPYDGTLGRPHLPRRGLGKHVTFHGVPFQSAWNLAGSGPRLSLRVFSGSLIFASTRRVLPVPDGLAAVNASIVVSSTNPIPLTQTTLSNGLRSARLEFSDSDSANANRISSIDMSSCAAGVPCKIATVRFHRELHHCH